MTIDAKAIAILFPKYFLICQIRNPAATLIKSPVKLRNLHGNCKKSISGKRHIIYEYSRVIKIEKIRPANENTKKNLSLIFLKLIMNSTNAKIDSKTFSFPNLKLIPSMQEGAEPPNPQWLSQS